MKELKIKSYPLSPDEFDYGAIVGTVRILGITKKNTSYFAHAGYFHWLLDEAEKIKSLPKKGMMGWFKVDLKVDR
jgi:hypothetical protein